MKYLQIGLAICFALLYNYMSHAQNDFSNSDSDFTYGVATKVQIEFSNKGAVAYKLSLTGGLGYDIENAVLPALHTGVLLSHARPGWQICRCLRVRMRPYSGARERRRPTPYNYEPGTPDHACCDH